MRGVAKSFTLGGRELAVLRGVSFQLAAGETLGVVGPSGSGKSTLLHILGTLERPTGGTVTLAGCDLYSLPEPALARLRNQTFFSLDALNERISELTGEMNERVMRHYGESRRQLFDRLDRPVLKPLPPTKL